MFNFLNNTASLGKAAAIYVLCFLFTGAGLVVGFEKLHNLPVDPVSSGLLFGAFSWAIGTLNFHMAAGNLQSQADVLTQIQQSIPAVTRAQAQTLKDVSNIISPDSTTQPTVGP